MKPKEKIILKQKLTSANQNDIVIHVADNDLKKISYKIIFFVEVDNGEEI